MLSMPNLIADLQKLLSVLLSIDTAGVIISDSNPRINRNLQQLSKLTRTLTQRLSLGSGSKNSARPALQAIHNKPLFDLSTAGHADAVELWIRTTVTQFGDQRSQVEFLLQRLDQARLTDWAVGGDTATMHPARAAEAALVSYDFGAYVSSVSGTFWKQLSASSPNEWTKSLICHDTDGKSFTAEFVVTVVNGVPASAKAYANGSGLFGTQRLEGLQSRTAVRDAVAALDLQARRVATAEQVFTAYEFGEAVHIDAVGVWGSESPNMFSRPISVSDPGSPQTARSAKFSVEFDSEVGHTPVWARAHDAHDLPLGDCNLPGNELRRKVERVIRLMSEDQVRNGLLAGTRHQVYALDAFYTGPLRMVLSAKSTSGPAHLFSMSPLQEENVLPTSSINGSIRLSPNFWTPLNGRNPVDMIEAFLNIIPASTRIDNLNPELLETNFVGFGTIVDEAGFIRLRVASTGTSPKVYKIYDLDYHGRAGEPLTAAPMPKSVFDEAMAAEESTILDQRPLADAWLIAQYGHEMTRGDYKSEPQQSKRS